MRVVIMKGLPGSGKSTLVDKLCLGETRGSTKICSADKYWIRPDGKYDFNFKLIGEAHKWCQSNFKATIVAYEAYKCGYTSDFQIRLLIVDNTNLTQKERKVYVGWCEAYNIPFEILEPETSWRYDAEECAKRNVHSVPLEVIKNMKDKLFRDKELHKDADF